MIIDYLRKYLSLNQRAMYYTTLEKLITLYLILSNLHEGFCQTNQRVNFMLKKIDKAHSSSKIYNMDNEKNIIFKLFHLIKHL